jgi:hypothetical protein
MTEVNQHCCGRPAKQAPGRPPGWRRWSPPQEPEPAYQRRRLPEAVPSPVRTGILAGPGAKKSGTKYPPEHILVPLTRSHRAFYF